MSQRPCSCSREEFDRVLLWLQAAAALTGPFRGGVLHWSAPLGCPGRCRTLERVGLVRPAALLGGRWSVRPVPPLAGPPYAAPVTVLEPVLRDCATVRLVEVDGSPGAPALDPPRLAFLPPLFAIEGFAANSPEGALPESAAVFGVLVADGMPVLEALEAAPALLGG